jgi:hypothetical protein
MSSTFLSPQPFQKGQVQPSYAYSRPYPTNHWMAFNSCIHQFPFLKPEFPMSSPKQRFMKDLKSISPSKCTNTHKLVYVQAAALAHGTIGLVKARTEEQSDREPFTNPARVVIVNKIEGEGNGLVDAGIVMIGSMTINENSDIALHIPPGATTTNYSLLRSTLILLLIISPY